MSKIKVSVIVTVFNSGDYLENCLESLKKQTLKEIEIIIINDGSSDPRDEIIIKNFTQYGSNFKCYKNENNSGTGFSREKGVGLATGEYIGFLDSDDTAEHYTYEMLYKSARDNDSEIAACNYANSYEEIEHLKEISSNNVEIVSGLNFYKCQVRRIHKPFYLRIDWWNKVYKRSMILDSGVSFPTVVRNEGTMSTFFSLLAKKCTIIDYPGFVSVNRPDSVCRNFKTKNIEDIAISIQHLHNCLRNLKTYDEHNTDFVRLYGYVLFNHNLQLIIKQPRDNRDKAIDYYLDYLSKSFFLRSFLLQYLNLPEKKIERLVFSSLCNKRNYDILRLVKKTDFFDRVEGGIVFKDRKNYLSAQKITLITITKDIISAGRVEYFEKMLSSVKNQTYGRENIEHIVVDGNSKDGTVDYLRQLDDDGIIDRWVSESDTGVYNAMNKGLLYSSGKYVLYLNSDDYLSHDALEVLQRKIVTERLDYAYSDAHKIDENDNKVGAHIANMDKVYFGSPYCHQTLLCRRKCFDKVIFDESFKITMWMFALDLHLHNFKGGYVESYLAYFRVGGISTDDLHKEKFKAEQDSIKLYLCENYLNINLVDYEVLNHLVRRWPLDDHRFKEVSIGNVVAALRKNQDPVAQCFLSAFIRLFKNEFVLKSIPKEMVVSIESEIEGLY